MKRLVLLALMVAACRPSDGNRSAPTKGGASAAAAGVVTGQQADSAQQDALLARADRARIQGDTSASVWVVEISDFECPYCRQWHEQTYPALERDFIRTGQVRMAYVNFPLAQHRHAVPAAEAAMCAAAQDKFWPMHDAIFNTQEKWVPLPDAVPLYDSLVVTVGANQAQWRDCMRSGVMKRLISADRARALQAKVGSTPTFFVGSESLAGAAPIDAFRQAIERARTKAGQQPR
ncbi:MAG TPA: thioredoxin domain-containing protein [Gemmatimonadaceae bacterium]|nr:thioredoxin domain-containing protein [Gemmatimonadaceae bacterium]